MPVTPEEMQVILEAVLMVAGEPVSITSLQNLFDEKPATSVIKNLLENISKRHQGSSIELKEVASGYRLQVKQEFSPWLSKLFAERTPRYSRAFLETLAIIAYRQPITRAEIEEIRGVSVSTNIIKALQEREWIRIIGYRELPGKPALYSTTKSFLDYFNLTTLAELPILSDFKTMEAQEDKLNQLNQIQLLFEEKSNSTKDIHETQN